MCQQVRCQKCGKPTWAGCGRHIEQALANVPRDQRCHCGDTSSEAKPATGDAPKKKLFGLF